MRSSHRFRGQHALQASVVIPTFNRGQLLAWTLESLARQDQDPETFEVIVCDDGSTDDSYTIFKTVARGANSHWKYVFYPDRGYHPTRARNMGIRLAEGEICILIDCGNLATTRLVSEHIAAHALRPQPQAIVGYIYNYGDSGRYHEESESIINPADLDETEKRILRTTSPLLRDARERFYVPCDDDISRYAMDWGLYWGGNCSVPSTVAYSVGGFDERYRSWGVDDCDFGLALKSAGLRFALRRQAACIQYPHPKDYSVRRPSAAKNCALLFENFPRQDTHDLLSGKDFGEMILNSMYSNQQNKEELAS